MVEADHQAVYAAEAAAFDGTDLEMIRPFDEIAAIAAKVLDGSWWPAGRVAVRQARADAASSSTRCRIDGSGQLPTIRLSAPQMTVATLAHELGHVLAGIAQGHGGIFRAAYLDVIRIITNLDTTDRRHDLHVDQLAEAFETARLGVGRRTWPGPPTEAGGAIAL